MSFLYDIREYVLKKWVSLLLMLFFCSFISHINPQDLIDNIEDIEELDLVLKPLKVMRDANGDSLLIVYDIDEWDKANKKTTSAMVFISNENLYYYNYIAFKRIFNIHKKSGKNSKPLINTPYLKDFSNNTIKLNEVSKKYIHLSPDSKWSIVPNSYNMFWVGNEYDFDMGRNNAAVNYDGDFELLDFNRECGLQILHKSLSDANHDYSAIMPFSYDSFSSTALTNFEENSHLKEVGIRIQFDAKGQNKSRAKSKSPNGNYYNVSNFDTQLYLLPSPVFDNSPVVSSSNIILIRDTKIDDFNKNNRLYTVYNKYSEIFNVYNLFLDDGSRKFFVKTKNEEIKLNGLVEKKRVYLSKVKAYGPTCAFFSVWPGAGLEKVIETAGFNDGKYQKMKRFSKVLKITSSILMASIVSSKIISINQYNSYLNNVYASGADRNYRVANFSQKVFVSSSFAYSLLSLIDLGFTIPIGTKYKRIANKINRYINLNFTNGLEIDN